MADTQEPEERMCAYCKKFGVKFQHCGRCKDTYYCSRDCQQKDWPKHKPECIPPDKRPPAVSEDVIVGFVECETYEDCRNYLQKHPELINKEVSDEMFQKGFITLSTHPPEFGTRFLRNAQILQYLIDIRKASAGQQDITLFFSRLLNPMNKEYLMSFETEYRGLVKRILQRHKERAKEKAEKEKNKESETKEQTA